MKKLIIILLVLLLTGCGVVNKVTDDDEEDTNTILPISAKPYFAVINYKTTTEEVIDPSGNITYKVVVDKSFISSIGGKGIYGSTIEIFSGWPYNEDVLIKRLVVTPYETFQVPINKSSEGFGCYVVQTEPGKRRSEPIVLW